MQQLKEQPPTHLTVCFQDPLLGVQLLEEVGLSLEEPQNSANHLLRVGLMLDQQVTQHLVKGCGIKVGQLLYDT